MLLDVTIMCSSHQNVLEVGFLRPTKVFGAPKSFMFLPKLQKLIFSINLNFVICPNIVGGFDSGPGDPGTIRLLGQFIEPRIGFWPLCLVNFSAEINTMHNKYEGVIHLHP